MEPEEDCSSDQVVTPDTFPRIETTRCSVDQPSQGRAPSARFTERKQHLLYKRKDRLQFRRRANIYENAALVKSYSWETRSSLASLSRHLTTNLGLTRHLPTPVNPEILRCAQDRLKAIRRHCDRLFFSRGITFNSRIPVNQNTAQLGAEKTRVSQWMTMRGRIFLKLPK